MKTILSSGKKYKPKGRSLKLKQGYDFDKFRQLNIVIDENIYIRLDTSDPDIREDRNELCEEKRKK